MATIQKRGKMWRAIVRRKGISKTKTFATKKAAESWALELEKTLIDGAYGDIPSTKTVADLFLRYREDVAKKKKGYRWEAIRLNRLCRDDQLANIRLSMLSPSDMAAWRDRRLKEVSPASVRRELSLINHAFNVAVKEWQWLRENPIKKIAIPKSPPPRDRVYTEDEIKRILYAANYQPGQLAETKMARVGAAFLFAIETAMRAGEIAAMRPGHIDLERRVARLESTKNGLPRDVPLSKIAINIIGDLPDGYFNLTTGQISSLFRKIKSRALIDDATFHDTRHTAITRLAKKLHVLDLARMVGIRDLKILMVYYNESPEELARKLD